MAKKIYPGEPESPKTWSKWRRRSDGQRYVVVGVVHYRQPGKSRRVQFIDAALVGKPAREQSCSILDWNDAMEAGK